MKGYAAAIERAVARLLAGRDAGGLWRDFWTPAGMSDQWVSAYVATALAGSGEADGIAAARETWRLLECDGFDRAGWAYARHVPLDADSTVWGLALAERLGLGPDEERVARAHACLGAHRRREGIATYAQAGPIRSFVRLPERIEFSAWSAAHGCVTAAAATLAAWSAKLAEPLLRAQLPDGSFPAYWWEERAYATAMAARALAREAGEPRVDAALARAAAWAADAAQATDAIEQPFRAALLVQLLAAVERPTEMHALAARLVAAQDENGGWRGSAWLRVPRPDCGAPERIAHWERWFGFGPAPTDPDEILATRFGICSVDQFGHFTTATVLEALARAAGRSACAAAARSARADLDRQTVQAFRTHGHVTLRDVFAPDLIAALRPAIVAAVRQRADAIADGRAPADRAAFIRAQGMWQDDAASRALALAPALGAIACELLGVARVRLLYDQAFFKPAGGGPTPWHQDLYYWPLTGDAALTFWIPLNPLEPGMGHLRFVDGSHLIGNVGDLDAMTRDPGKLDAFVAERGLAVSDVPELPLGALSVHHGWTIHGAGENRSARERAAVTVVAYPDGATLAQPDLAGDGSIFERQAAAIRAAELRTWFPGLGPGDRAVSRCNPLLAGERGGYRRRADAVARTHQPPTRAQAVAHASEGGDWGEAGRRKSP